MSALSPTWLATDHRVLHAFVPGRYKSLCGLARRHPGEDDSRAGGRRCQRCLSILAGRATPGGRIGPARPRTVAHVPRPLCPCTRCVRRRVRETRAEMTRLTEDEISTLVCGCVRAWPAAAAMVAEYEDALGAARLAYEMGGGPWEDVQDAESRLLNAWARAARQFEALEVHGPHCRLRGHGGVDTWV